MVDIVVTGVGSYDVSIAAHPRQKLLSFLVFGKPMTSRRASMHTGALVKPELREQDCDIKVLPGRPIQGPISTKAHASKFDGSASRYIRRHIFWLGPRWETWFWSEPPGAFGKLPARRRNAKTCSTHGTGGPAWARHRAGRVIRVAHGLMLEARGRKGEVVLNLRGPDGHANSAAGRIVAVTGYSTEVRCLEPFAGLFSDRGAFGGAPASDYRFGSSVDNSLSAGFASGPSFASSMRFTYCVRIAAARIARSISRIAAKRILAGGFTIHQTA